jgi:hypothetical protein
VIAMIVREHDVGDVREIDAEFRDVLLHGWGARTGVNQDAAAVGFKHRREAPFADAIRAPLAHQHRREHGHLHRLGERRRGRLRPGASRQHG